MLLLMVLVGTILYPVDSVKIVPPSDVNEHQIPADISEEHISKNNGIEAFVYFLLLLLLYIILSFF